MLLLLATMVNYMDRLTLNLLAVPIERELNLTDNQYADLEMAFGLAFALGAIVFGFAVDRFNVFWVYPLAVLAWSAAGFCTGFAAGFASLLFFRTCLGFAEAANWPCALRTTQRILPPEDRSAGNSILQSGAAVGAILIPLSLLVLFDESVPGSWRRPFFFVGAGGALWVVLWWASLRPSDLRLEEVPTASREAASRPALSGATAARRFAVLITLVITINMTWHFLRAWGPKYLMRVHDFSQDQVSWFSSAYYVFTDLGALSAGFATLWLARNGMPVHASRRLVFLFCAALAGLCLAVPLLPGGAALVAVLLVIGFGALGVFPMYYAFSQDLTVRHQGKVTGILGACCWLAMALWQKSIGWMVTGTGSYSGPFIIAGLAPLIGFAALMLLWGPTEEKAEAPAPAKPAVPSEAIKANVGALRS
jgi:ACS family hexuronate transporter-like MFS transporter